MCFRSLVVPFLLISLTFQTQAELFRQRYEAAEALRRAGNLTGAEAQYTSILSESYHKLGRIYSAQNNYQGAVGVLETAVSYGPESQSALIDLAIAYFYVGQYRRALDPLNKAVALDSQNGAAHHMLGKTYFMLSEFEKATSELLTAVKLAPKDYDVAYTLALAYLKARERAPAQRIFDRMISELGNRPQLRVLIGRAYRETGFLAEAIDEFKKASSLDVNFPRVHYYLGLTYLLKDGASRLADAAAEFKLELASHPNEFFANYYLGILSSIDRKWNVAVDFLLEASRIQPNNPDPYFYLGQAYQGLAKHEQAIDVLKKAIQLNPDLGHNEYQVTNAHFRLGQSLIKVGRTEEGQKEVQLAADLKSKALKKDEAKADAFINAADLSTQTEFPELATAAGVVARPDGPAAGESQELISEAHFFEKVIGSAHDNIGLLRAARQDFRNAAEQFRLAVKWDPQRDSVHYNLGLAYFKSELYKEALSPLENELKMRPTNLPARQLLGLSYFMTEDYHKAAAILSEVVAAKPNDVALYYPLAISLSKEGKNEAVEKVVRQMLASGGTNAQIHILLARVYYEQGDATKALEELQAALALSNRVPLAHFYSGLVYVKMGKLSEAAREFEGELSINAGDIQAKYYLGYVLLANQETKRGMTLMQEVIAAQPDFSNAHFELGKAQFQQGDIKGAVQNLEVAAKLTPDAAHVHYQLGRAYLAAGRKAEGEVELERSKQLKEKARSQTN